MKRNVLQFKNVLQSKKAKRRAVAAGAGLFAAASLFVSSVAATPGELFNGAEPAGMFVTESESNAHASGEPTALDRLRARLRARFFARRSIVRGAILLPFWTVGKALAVVGTLLATALSPVWQAVLLLLLNAGVLFGLFLLVYKLLFPHKSLKKFFTKRNILLLSGGALLFAAVDAVLRVFWKEYRPISIALKLVTGLIVLALLSWRIFGKRRPIPAPAAS